MPATVRKEALDKNKAVDVETHEDELEKRAAKRAAKQPKLRKMLKADAAAEVEALKPRLRFKVSAELKTGRKESVVTAQNEADAWAIFCDQNKTWPSPNWCERVVEKV